MDDISEREEGDYADNEDKASLEDDHDEDDDKEGPDQHDRDDSEAEKNARLHKYKPAPVVSLISKHTNGTLNLWNIMFADKSKFSSLLNISHQTRVSGHRFRVNDITCHPVLPLLLTTSHHNVVNVTDNVELGVGQEVSLQPYLSIKNLNYW